MQSACDNNQCTYERGTVRRLHCWINMTDHRSVKQRVCVCVCVRACYMYLSNREILTPSKYFVIVALQTIFRTQFVGIFIIS